MQCLCHTLFSWKRVRGQGAGDGGGGAALIELIDIRAVDFLAVSEALQSKYFGYFRLKK